MGTNAIGNVNAEQRPAGGSTSTILNVTRFLTCIATAHPRPDRGRARHPDSPPRVRPRPTPRPCCRPPSRSSRTGSSRPSRCRGGVIRFHHQPEALAPQGLAAFDEAGGFLACNRRAERLLGTGDTRISRPAYWDIFETRWNSVLTTPLQSSARPTKLRSHRGRESSPTCWSATPAGAPRLAWEAAATARPPHPSLTTWSWRLLHHSTLSGAPGASWGSTSRC